MAMVEYTELVILILGVMFAPFNGENVEGAYFDAVNTGSLVIEPLVFNCRDKGMRFEFFSVDGDSRQLLFTILRGDRESLVFKIQSPGNVIEINLAEYLPTIDKQIFKWGKNLAEKSLQFKDGIGITVYRVGETIYLKTDEYEKKLFCIHK